MSYLNFGILACSNNFCPIKTDLPGNTVWPQASGFPKLAKMDHFWHFQLTFVHSKCKRSSLRSQHWMRLFLWCSNTVALLKVSFLIFWFQKIILKRSRIQLRSPCFFTLLSHNEFLAWRHSCRPQIHQKYNRVIHKYITSTLRKNIVHCWKKSQKKSHSILRAKRATFTFWVDKS